MWVDKKYGDEYETEDDVWETINIELSHDDILKHGHLTPGEMLRELIRLGSPLVEDAILEAEEEIFRTRFEEIPDEDE
jgi:hypothetical protein